jgi:hypothetical protein
MRRLVVGAVTTALVGCGGYIIPPSYSGTTYSPGGRQCEGCSEACQADDGSTACFECESCAHYTGLPAGAPTPPYTDAGDFCARLERGANTRSQRQMAWGIVNGVLAFLAVSAAGVTALADDTPSRAARITTAALPVGAAVLGVVSTTLITRSANASDLASAATTALQLPEDSDRAQACNEALSAWHSGRSSSAAAFEQRLGNLRNQTEESRQATQEAEAAEARATEARERLEALVEGNHYLLRLRDEGLLPPSAITEEARTQDDPQPTP